jgi:hypothetical protein
VVQGETTEQRYQPPLRASMIAVAPSVTATVPPERSKTATFSVGKAAAGNRMCRKL